MDDADFYPFGGERTYTSTSGNTYKFTGKERDTESGLDDFGARYFTSQFGRFMTPDWSASPVLVPYADLGNPQTFNLYAYVSNNPLNGIDPEGHFRLDPGGELYTDPDATGRLYGKDAPPEQAQQQAQQQDQSAPADQEVQQPQPNASSQDQQPMMIADKGKDVSYGSAAREQAVDFNLVQKDQQGNVTPVEKPADHKVELKEKLVAGDPKKVTICEGQCVTKGNAHDMMRVTAGRGHSVEKRFEVDGKHAKIYDSGSKKSYDYVRVDASVKKGFVFSYGNDPN